jgi:hypothetical protein
MELKYLLYSKKPLNLSKLILIEVLFASKKSESKNANGDTKRV